MKNIIFTLLSCLLLFNNTNAQCNEGEDIIVNGSFETGDYTGWTITNNVCNTTSTITDVSLPGTITQGVTTYVISPVEGIYTAIQPLGPTATFEGCAIRLCQEVTIPSNASSANFIWNENIQHSQMYFALHQVSVYNSTNNNVLEILHTIPSTPTPDTQSQWDNFSVDLVAYAGQTINLCFVDSLVADLQQTVGNAQYDDISLIVTCSQEPSINTDIPTLSEWGLILMSILLLTYGTLVIVGNSTSLATSGSFQLLVPNTTLPFNKQRFNLSLILTAVLVLIGFAFSIILYGSVFISDIIGVSFTAPVFAYFVHLLLLIEKE